jgi:UDP-N-acetylmuramate dehydrogenase
MKIELNATLREHNTFGFDVSAQYLVHLTEVVDVPELIQKAQKDNVPWQIFGGGSNLVLAKDLDGYTGLMKIKGRQLLRETATHFYIEAMAGESWHELVLWSLENNYDGLENLALIPGTVGAAPIQNIGAYGLELAQVFDSLCAFDTLSNKFIKLSKEQCEFSYRNSIFKKEPGRYVVVSVCFELSKEWQANLSYAELNKAFQNQEKVLAKDICEKVCEIRQAKLPDPQLIGNVGSFFHNPVVSHQQHFKLKQEFPLLVSYPTDASNHEGEWKLAAGWLIDQCGFKGQRHGNVGVYEKQALVLVNHGGGTGPELLKLADTIKQKVKETFGVSLTIEPIIYQ